MFHCSEPLVLLFRTEAAVSELVLLKKKQLSNVNMFISLIRRYTQLPLKFSSMLPVGVLCFYDLSCFVSPSDYGKGKSDSSTVKRGVHMTSQPENIVVCNNTNIMSNTFVKSLYYFI